MGVALRYIPDRDLAGMIVNDSFLKIFTHISGFRCDDRENFGKALKGWMAKITVRMALNEIRKHKSRRPHEPLTMENKESFSITLPDHLHMEDILELINTLPENYKKVFVLYEIEGFNHDEIGALMAISASSSRVYLTRAKEKLRMLYRTLMA